MQTGIRFAVRENDEEILVYHEATIRQAVERLAFIREFFPTAKFVFEPLKH